MELKKIMDGVDKKGFMIVKSSYDYKNLPKKDKYLIFSNRRMKQSIIIKKDILQPK